MKKSRRSDCFVLVFSLLCSTIVAGLIVIVSPIFERALNDIGAQLLAMTCFFIQFRWAFLILPIIAFFLWKFWPNPSSRSLMAALFGILCVAVVLPMFVVSMYWPIFSVPTIHN